LKAWEEDIDFVKEVYWSTTSFPEQNNKALNSQIRRCAISIPSNIAEGAARNSKKEFIQFYISV